MDPASAIRERNQEHNFTEENAKLQTGILSLSGYQGHMAINY